MGRKKTCVKKKKGGGRDIFAEGPLLPQNLEEAKKLGTFKKIKESYDEKFNSKNKDIQHINETLQYLRQSNDDKEKRDAALTSIRNTKIIADDKLAHEKFRTLANITLQSMGGIFSGIKSTLSAGMQTASLAFNAGEGILFKIIIIVIFIVLTVLFYLGIIPTNINVSTNNDISKMIINSDNENNIFNPQSGNIISRLSRQMYNMVPDNYKVKFNSINNSISYITTGKNQYDEYLEDRETITTGRNDNIFNINRVGPSEGEIANLVSEKTYSLLKPRSININFIDNNNGNYDFYKINTDLRTDINYPNKMTINFKQDVENGKYLLDIDNPVFYKNNDTTPVNSSKIDKKHYLFVKNKNKIELNSFKNINYNDNINFIAIYGLTLINKKYKGPIITIKKIDDSRDDKYEYVNIFYDVDEKKLVYDYNNKKKELDFSKNPYYNIYRLFDQTGNNHNYVFDNGNDIDDKYPPMLIYTSATNEYSIEFFSRAILYLEKIYPNIKSKIEVNIRLKNNSEFTNIIDYMDLLSSRKSSIVKLKFDSGNAKYNIDVNNESNANFPYSSNNINNQNIEFNLNNTSSIECLGVVHDVRSKIEIDTKTKRENRDNYIRQHAFIGYLNKLILYKQES